MSQCSPSLSPSPDRISTNNSELKANKFRIVGYLCRELTNPDISRSFFLVDSWSLSQCDMDTVRELERRRMGVPQVYCAEPDGLICVGRTVALVCAGAPQVEAGGRCLTCSSGMCGVMRSLGHVGEAWIISCMPRAYTHTGTHT